MPRKTWGMCCNGKSLCQIVIFLYINWFQARFGEPKGRDKGKDMMMSLCLNECFGTIEKKYAWFQTQTCKGLYFNLWCSLQCWIEQLVQIVHTALVGEKITLQILLMALVCDFKTIQNCTHGSEIDFPQSTVSYYRTKCPEFLCSALCSKIRAAPG